MAQKKFGAFGGVFTPSILTILGVIMYMRLPWIVGNAGLFLTIGIILIAHVVSITTGLSVSSIATDKKVKAGGTYYIISRSLGLPIGGTLGIALFFGLSLSVSLYLIGFSESFLAFWGFPIDKNSIRIAGSIALLFVGTLTFISTSLAIKTQYFIMAAIGLSLITILFGKHDFTPVEPLLNPIENSAPIILLFAVFFPAVTGFEAGVSMSGDLKNPKNAIPYGTISAIIIGLIVYIGLAIFFSHTVSAEQLANNPNILLDISFFPPLLVAGIWGATISSAIGSILGAPRILQATSLDKITPKVFGKGFGQSNEPRNALILTFLIAEAGILIGELNLIARIVSMFFITTYGFLNLSSTIEKLVSTDFRPSFKIPVWVSIIGAVVSIFLMLELDFIAFIGAVIIMGTIFIYLKNKELTLESGDTWEGVWSSILRAGLNRLNRTQIKQRNWRPNIILFSGGVKARPYLIELGRWLVKKRGILSNFSLVENKKASRLIKRPKDISKEKSDQFEGIFTRELEVSNIYEGMETITKLYGFAGIEPNTIMMGWARESKDPEAFNRLLRIYQKLDYNVFILDYDKEKQFGSKRTIDLWWRGSNNNATLALTIIKFLQMDDDWDEVNVRILIVTNDSAIHNRVYKNVNQILDDQRLQAEVKLINNSIENKPIQEIINTESSNTDLVIIGLPSVEKNYALIENTENILANLNTVLLVHASSFFNPIYIGIEDTVSDKLTDVKLLKHESVNQIVLPQNETLAKPISDFNHFVSEEFRKFKDEYLVKIVEKEIELIETIKANIVRYFDDLDKNITVSDTQKSRKEFARIISNFIFNSRRLIENYKEKILAEQHELLSVGSQLILTDLKNFNNNYSSELIHEISYSNKKIKKSLGNKLLSLFNDSKKIKIDLNLLISNLVLEIENDLLKNSLQKFALKRYKFIANLQKIFNTEVDLLMRTEKKIEKDGLDAESIGIELESITRKFTELSNEIKDGDIEIFANLVDQKNRLIQNAADEIQNFDVNKINKKRRQEIKKSLNSKIELNDLPSIWYKNQNLLSNFFIEDIYLKSFQDRSETILEKFLQYIINLIDNNYLKLLNNVKLQIEESNISSNTIEFKNVVDRILNPLELTEELSKDLNGALESMPDVIEIMDQESFQSLDTNQFGDPSVLEINLKNYLIFLIETEIIDPLQDHLNIVSNKLNRTKDTLLDVVRFTNYNITQVNSDTDENQELYNSILKRSSDRIEREIENIISLKENLINTNKLMTEKTYGKLNPFLISRSVGSLKHIVRIQDSRELLDTVQTNYEKIKLNLRKIVVDIVYRKSEGILLAKKLKDQSYLYQSEIGRILDFVNEYEPDFYLLNKLPFYYKQLFLGNHFRSKEFLIERKSEIEKAEKTYNNFKSGYHGALLIIGERYSGKTTLSNTIASLFFDQNNTFEINGFEGGSSSILDFEKQLSIALKQEGDAKSLLNSLPSESTIIINDLELWWERNSSGLEAVKEIISLIEEFSTKIFFIVNINKYAYRLINRIIKIENLFINSIQCQPFDAEEIQQAILLRHRSSGLKFEYQNQTEDQLSSIKLANLFNTYFELSNGNIGSAIYCWLSNITSYDDQDIAIRKPIEVKDDIFKHLDKEWMIILQQFIFHKFFNLRRINNVMDNKDQLTKIISTLKRSGLIREMQNNSFEINPYLHHVITQKLIEMKLL